MIARPTAASEIAVSLRREKGMTQERLAQSAGVDRRTIQRLEKGERISPHSLTRVASALGVSIAALHGPRSVSALIELAVEMTCLHCGAPVLNRGTAEYENVDIDYEVFECGAEDGLRFRPCPKDPRFPAFTDYELEFYEEPDMVYCYASGKTEMARAVQLEQGFGRTREAAARWVERSYISARDGHEAAEMFYPLTSHL